MRIFKITISTLLILTFSIFYVDANETNNLMINLENNEISEEPTPCTSYDWWQTNFSVPYRQNRQTVQFKGPYNGQDFLIHQNGSGYNYRPTITWEIADGYDGTFAVYVYFVENGSTTYQNAYTCSGNTGSLPLDFRNQNHTDGYRIMIANRSGRTLTFNWMRLVS